ncbi:pilus assembly protein [Halopseudomonas nanhaiensis]|uniref:TadE family protein n=1 Tax=Halopseudomonas nanhaiensis TaxID=2830842 RepID=UPI001CBB2C3F|nr:TadE family protein [Halopseudomonas nanhaiensis]UAW99498.1 pilus assembly protein [Halopseudomonas nanhaiensis]
MSSAIRGQALVEFLVTAVLVLVPLFIAMVTLGKYLDARHKVELGARYIAWERTVWSEGPQGWPSVATGKSDNEIRGETQARVFGRRDQGIQSDVDEALKRYSIDPLLEYAYGHPTGNGPILRQTGNVSEFPLYVNATSERQAAPGTAGVTESALRWISNVPLFARFDIAQQGAHTGRVALSLRAPARISEMAELDIQLDRSVTLITDPWNAGGAGHVRRRVQGLTPTSHLDGIASVLTDLPFLVGPLEVVGRLELGYIDPDRVPQQYLERY